MSRAPSRPHARPQARPLCLALLGLFLAQAPAHAAGPRALEAVPAQSYDIPAGPLGRTLSGFAVRAGIALSFDPSLTDGLNSPALNGNYAGPDAMARLLAGSGLEVVARGDGSYTLRRTTAAAGARGDAVLPVVVVTASATAAQESATGPVQGYVARRSATGTKTDTPLIETPQSISVITADEIGDRKAETLDETLRYTAGVTPNSKPWSADQFSLLRGFELGNTGIFMDGLLNPNVSYMATIDPYGLERLEVLRGPASVLYGQMAPGGMVNAVSKRPTKDTVRELGVEYGTYDRKQVKADFGGAIDGQGTWTYRLTMLGRKSDTRLDLDYDDRVFIAPSLTWQPLASTKLTLLGLYQEDDQSYAWPNQLQNPGALGQPADSVNIGGYDNRWQRTNKMLGYELEHRFNDTWSLRQNLRYNDLHRVGTDVFPLTLAADGRNVTRALLPRVNDWEGVQVDTQTQAGFSTGPVTHTVLAGVDYTHSRLTWSRVQANAMMPPLNLYAPVYAPQPLSPMANPYHDDMPMKQTGLYVQEQLKWNRLAVTAGLRHDDVSETSTRTFFNNGAQTHNYDQEADATTGRAGLVYLFDSGWAPYLSYATSFAPETGVSVSGAPLQPSRGKQMEAGVRYQPSSGALNFTASVFDLVRQNVTTAAPGNPGAFVQTGEAKSRGLELEVRAELTRQFSVIAQYTYLDTEVTRSNNGDEGLPLSSAPKHSASAWSKYEFGIQDNVRAFAALGVRYLGKARSAQDYDNLDITNPSLTLVDAAFGVDYRAWRLSLNINNLFGTQKLMDCDGTFCYRSAERTANLSALYRF